MSPCAISWHTYSATMHCVNVTHKERIPKIFSLWFLLALKCLLFTFI